MKCKYCAKNIKSKGYIEHLIKEHPSEYEAFKEEIIELNNKGYTISEIASEIKATKAVVTQNLNLLMESPGKYNIKIPLNIKTWEPKDFKLEATTVWSFKQRGNWATHNGKYRGNWSPYIPRNLILRYSKENDVVLDPFIGSGTTLVETKLLKRKGIGVDINPL